ncbi:MAG: 16S rRNA (guanine(527)-N(7))-methyltransferase RsmG [Prevotellaceae bacterium]|nr:16S rRNA (guanine(527)-N(7))-methyltransferase RsmG [Prevotellaceae bacterium]
MDIIRKYFPNLTDEQLRQFALLKPLYEDWNQKINVISRKDIGSLYEHHVLHSLAIAEIIDFRPETSVMDLGTGGGFPGIPLAIMFPQCSFHLVDSTKKKILVCSEIAKALGLQNVSTEWARAEVVKRRFDFVVCRAVMPIPDLVRLVRKNISPKSRNATPNGVICLKGGDLQAETRPLGQAAEVMEVSDYFEEEYFKGKKIVYINL